MSDGRGRDLTVIYYADEDAIRAWKAEAEHVVAQRLGRERWYSSYSVEVAKVARAYFVSEDVAGEGGGDAGETGRSVP